MKREPRLGRCDAVTPSAYNEHVFDSMLRVVWPQTNYTRVISPATGRPRAMHHKGIGRVRSFATSPRVEGSKRCSCASASRR